MICKINNTIIIVQVYLSIVIFYVVYAISFKNKMICLVTEISSYFTPIFMLFICSHLLFMCSYLLFMCS